MYFGGRESSPVLVHPQDTLCTVHSALAPRTAPRTLSRTGGRLADGRSFGAVGGKHKQGPAGGGVLAFASVIAGGRHGRTRHDRSTVAVLCPRCRVTVTSGRGAGPRGTKPDSPHPC